VKQHTDATVVDNPGGAVEQCYTSAADTLVTFEGTYASYVNWSPPAWESSASPSQLWHLVYDTPDENSMKNAIALSKARNAGYVYVTPDSGSIRIERERCIRRHTPGRPNNRPARGRRPHPGMLGSASHRGPGRPGPRHPIHAAPSGRPLARPGRQAVGLASVQAGAGRDAKRKLTLESTVAYAVCR
jgi:hypothetical protein